MSNGLKQDDIKKALDVLDDGHMQLHPDTMKATEDVYSKLLGLADV